MSDDAAEDPTPRLTPELADAIRAVEVERQHGTGVGWTSIKSWALDRLRDEYEKALHPETAGLLTDDELLELDSGNYFIDRVDNPTARRWRVRRRSTYSELHQTIQRTTFDDLKDRIVDTYHGREATSHLLAKGVLQRLGIEAAHDIDNRAGGTSPG